MAAARLPGVARHARAELGQARLSADRLPGLLLLLGTQGEGRPQDARRDRSGAAAHLCQARHPAGRAGPAGRHRRRRGVRQRLRRHHLSPHAGKAGDHLLLDLRGGAEAPRAGTEISRHRRALCGQFLCHLELRGVHRRLLRLHPEGCALSDGVVDLFPHQRRPDRPVRAHPDHRRRRQLCELSRGLHRADARREPAACRGGRAGRARRCRDQVLDGAELVPRRRERQGRDLQFRHQAGRLPRPQLEDLLDPGRDRLGDHLEVSQLHPAGRQFGREVLLHRHHQQSPAGRYRHQDDPYRAQYAQHHHLQGHLGRPRQQHLSRAGPHPAGRGQRAKPHAMRLSADR